MLVNYPLELQEKTSVCIKNKTPLTNLLILNIKYTDQIRPIRSSLKIRLIMLNIISGHILMILMKVIYGHRPFLLF